jgi:pimeloyl-ACP methyl ester carboxylesterase
LADPFDYARVDLMDVGWTFIRDVVDALGLHRADLVANSMGAFMSIALLSTLRSESPGSCSSARRSA